MPPNRDSRRDFRFPRLSRDGLEPNLFLPRKPLREAHRAVYSRRRACYKCGSPRDGREGTEGLAAPRLERLARNNFGAIDHARRRVHIGFHAPQAAHAHTGRGRGWAGFQAGFGRGTQAGKRIGLAWAEGPEGTSLRSAEIWRRPKTPCKITNSRDASAIICLNECKTTTFKEIAS